MAIQKQFFVTLGITFWLLTVVFALLPSWPHLYYRLSPQTSSALASTIASTVDPANVTPGKDPASIQITPTATPAPILTPSPTPTFALPEVDPSLPVENGLIIDKIGVRGEIHEGEDWENILKTGIWRVPNFGTPMDATSNVIPGADPESIQITPPSSHLPIILAAHRWGYLEWSASFRKLNSFYNLPNLKEGDTFSIVWNQRQFDYEVYAVGSGTEIADYSAHVILYTCQLWNSPVRYFVYANRTN